MDRNKTNSKVSIGAAMAFAMSSNGTFESSGDKQTGFCPKCGRIFKTKSGKANHLKNYHGEK